MHDLITTTIAQIAAAHNLVLDDEQLHVGNERAILSPHKFVFTGTRTTTGKRIIFKCANHPDGIGEMYSEHRVLQTLQSLPFSTELLATPKELYFGSTHGYTISLTEFIAQETVFPAYSLKEQLFMALQALESQEAFHATTTEHRGYIRDAFTIHSPAYYRDATATFCNTIASFDTIYKDVLLEISTLMNQSAALLQIYDGYLMHTDFVPHNFRIADQIYLLDYSSFRLGNKYESWARFTNFMEVHSPALVPLLIDYVHQDRGSEEAVVYKLMRIHKTLFLVQFYINAMTQTSGDMHHLSELRVRFWMDIVRHLLDGTRIPEHVITRYKKIRDKLRSETEKDRQREFTVL